jgi:hypothetical protein
LGSRPRRGRKANAMDTTNLVNQDGEIVASLAPVIPPYGEVQLDRPDSYAVYDNRNGKTTTAIRAKVFVNAINGALDCNVKGTLDKDGGVDFEVSIPKGLSLRGSARDAFKGHVNLAIGKWSERERAFRDAHKALTAPKPTAADIEAGGKMHWKPSDASKASGASKES